MELLKEIIQKIPWLLIPTCKLLAVNTNEQIKTLKSINLQEIAIGAQKHSGANDNLEENHSQRDVISKNVNSEKSNITKISL